MQSSLFVIAMRLSPIIYSHYEYVENFDANCVAYAHGDRLAGEGGRALPLEKKRVRASLVEPGATDTEFAAQVGAGGTHRAEHLKAAAGRPPDRRSRHIS